LKRNPRRVEFFYQRHAEQVVAGERETGSLIKVSFFFMVRGGGFAPPELKR
jgi:hypothetical protein